MKSVLLKVEVVLPYQGFPIGSKETSLIISALLGDHRLRITDGCRLTPSLQKYREAILQSSIMPDANQTAMYKIDEHGALLTTELPFPKRSGKVRDVYDLGEHFLIVSTDRISAFDYILPSGIPNKGRILTGMSRFWFDRLETSHHLVSTEVPMDLRDKFDTTPLVGRVMLAKKANVIPFECVVRGYLEGSGLKEYNATGEICGNQLPAGLVQCDRLPTPIFTPATKAEEGHDENVSIDRMVDELGSEMALRLRDRSLQIYNAASEYAASRGIIIADTKFEFGMVGDQLTLIDEVLTPDSSRFWAADSYQPGNAQPSFDKQFVREWLSGCGWDKQSDPPPLPDDIVRQTAEKYADAFHRITGATFAPK